MPLVGDSQRYRLRVHRRGLLGEVVEKFDNVRQVLAPPNHDMLFVTLTDGTRLAYNRRYVTYYRMEPAEGGP